MPSPPIIACPTDIERLSSYPFSSQVESQVFLQ
jgi:hypothetical protein